MHSGTFTPRTYAIRFVGCARRQIDCERIRNWMEANGLAGTSVAEDADLVFVCSCGLSRETEDDSIANLEAALTGRGQVVFIGCLPAMNPERVKAVYAGRTVSTKDLDRLDEVLPGFSVKFREVPDANRAFEEPPPTLARRLKRAMRKLDMYEPLRLYRAIERVVRQGLDGTGGVARAVEALLPSAPFAIDFNNAHFTLRVAEGCRGACTYCNIRRAIGTIRSKPIDVVLAELRTGLAAGRTRLNVVSSDTGAWGTDIGLGLPDLLAALLAEDDRVVVEFIQDLHPRWLCRYRDELRRLLATRRIRSLLTAVQSGSERILRLMGRHADLDEFCAVVRALRRSHPGLRLRTQVIVGFPTETEEDVEATIRLLRRCRFQEVDLFRYFEVPGMASLGIEPKVPAATADRRRTRIARSLPFTVSAHVI